MPLAPVKRVQRTEGEAKHSVIYFCHSDTDIALVCVRLNMEGTPVIRLFDQGGLKAGQAEIVSEALRRAIEEARKL